MKTHGTLLFVCFYLLGTVCLPMGDFAAIKDLPEMFRHCKATEDADLNVVEFFAEHVMGLGQLLELAEHEEEDEDGDKPHAPVQFHIEQQQVICSTQQLKAPVAKPVAVNKPNAVFCRSAYVFNYSAAIFRPPIV